MAVLSTETLDNGNTIHTMQMWWLPINKISLDILVDTFGEPTIDDPAPIWGQLAHAAVQYEEQADEKSKLEGEELYRTLAEPLGLEVIITSVKSMAEADQPEE